MLTKIMFRTCTLMLLINLIACVPDDSVVPKYEAEARFATFDSDALQPPVSGIPLPPISTFLVKILASDCTVDGATLIATNPNLPGNPPYTQSNFLVEWYKNSQLIGTGAQLSECVCGENIQAKVTNTDTGAKAGATYIAKPCKAILQAEQY